MSGFIQEGFPKLAFWAEKEYINKYDLRRANPLRRITYLPEGTRAWPNEAYELTFMEPLILIAERDQYRYLNKGRAEKFKLIHFVPLKYLLSKKIPITSVYNWKKSYKRFPAFSEEFFIMPENKFEDFS